MFTRLKATIYAIIFIYLGLDLKRLRAIFWQLLDFR